VPHEWQVEEMSTEKFRVTWEAADGYVGGSRPHSFNITSDELEEDMSDDDLSGLFEERLREEFLESVSADTSDEDRFIAWAKQQIEEMKSRD
jgi:hypothetical protein